MKCVRGMPARSTRVQDGALELAHFSTWLRSVSASFSTILAVKRMPISSFWMDSCART